MNALPAMQGFVPVMRARPKAGALLHPADIETPRRATKAMRSARAQLEAAIEAALVTLDLLDGDEHLEDSFDREAVCEDEGAITGDDEPWLACPIGCDGFGNLAYGCEDDREIDRQPVEQFA